MHEQEEFPGFLSGKGNNGSKTLGISFPWVIYLSC